MKNQITLGKEVSNKMLNGRTCKPTSFVGEDSVRVKFTYWCRDSRTEKSFFKIYSIAEFVKAIN
jgi:hypothetical protein